MASIRRNASHASITLKRTAQGYHLLQTLPSTYLANDTGNSARRKSPAIEDDPLSSSDDSSKSAADDKGGSNALRSTADGWREPPMRITKAEEGKHPLKADMGGSSGTAFRDPSKMNLSSPPQRRSNRTQNGKGSPKRSREEVEADREDNLLDEFGLIPLSQGQSKSKKMRVYGPAVNIHGSGNIGRTQHSSKKSPSRVKKGDKGGFRTPNLEAIEEKLKTIDPGLPDRSFKMPSTKYAESPRSLRSSKRSTQARRTFSDKADVNEFKEPILHHGITPSSKVDESCNFIVPVSVSGDDHVSRDMHNVAEGVLGTSASNFRMPTEAVCPTSSATASLTLSPFDDPERCYASSLSSPPASPILDASQEHYDFLASATPTYQAPVVARCPMCKEEVDRGFLEDFDCGKRMDVRRQTRFCRAHKQETAKTEWRKRSYPDIDWSIFDDRLKRHHPHIKRILDSDVSSFYKNILEDSVNRGRNRTLHQSIMGAGFHGLTPGYYGSRGARLMMDNIMSNFSSQIRRLAATDKLISSGGVSGYVQAVLVPELAVLLVKEDMQVEDEAARVILQESIQIGDLLNEEEEEVIRGKVAGDESDGDVDDMY